MGPLGHWNFGACVLNDGNLTSGSGVGVTVTVSPGPGGTYVANIASGVCGVRASGATFTIFADEDELLVRILADRSVADIFLQGGRWAATQGWQHTAPRKPADSNVMVWSGSGTLIAQRDKTHLVPFGEYLPLQNLLEAMGFRQLTKMRGGYTPGHDTSPIILPDSRRLHPLICYEAIFPYRARTSPRPDVLVNLLLVSIVCEPSNG